MQKQAFYKQVHVCFGKVLTTLHLEQNSVSLLGRDETQTTTANTLAYFYSIMLGWSILTHSDSSSWHF